jgi:hypothetical protein
VDGLRQTRDERTVTTDDRGDYRMWDFSPGRYYLKATGQDSRNFLSGTGMATPLDGGDSFAPVYSGGGQTMDSAKAIEIGAATRATDDFQLKLKPAWQIRGTLRNFTPGPNITFALVIAGEEVPAGPDLFNRNSGAFEFKDVVSGSYILRAVQGDNTGEVAVNVAGSDATGVVLALYPPVDIPVTVRFTNAPDPEHEPEAPDKCTVSLIPQQIKGSARPIAPVFVEDGYARKILPGLQRIKMQCFDGYVRSALAGNQDLLAVPVLTVEPGGAPPPVEILATHGGGSVSGKIDSSLFGSSRQIQTLLIPQFSGSTGPVLEVVIPGSEQNAFAFRNLAPGSYTVYAFADPDIEFRNPEFLKSLTGGQSVQIDGDAKEEVTIDKVIP